ncbi:MAG: MATE family efflux transporter [Duncaniella sp.]|nr:MATE family efflux transporter [Duncaniella sp.]
MLASPSSTSRLLGSSEALLPLCNEYLIWMTPALVLNIWSIIGLFIVRLDGSPKYAMWCNVLPGILNIGLDFIFVYILGMGLAGAALATSLAIATGAAMAIWYLGFGAATLRLRALPLDGATVRDTLRNVTYQARIGISAFLGEVTMAMLMFTGNQMFMRYLGDDGVAAFGIACYYCPFFFMIGNAIAQSAQPIISFNYGLGAWDRVRATETLAIKTALGFGIIVTLLFVLCPRLMTELFIDPASLAAEYAIAGLPLFAACIIWFIFNVTAIGYFQSVERVAPSVWFALLRGILFLVPAFIGVPLLLGPDGLWLALAASETLTSLAIITYYLLGKIKN